MVEEQREPDRWRIGAIVLAVAVVVLIGVIIGYIVSGGLDGPEAVNPSTTSTMVSASTTLEPVVTTTIPEETTTVVPTSPVPTVVPDESVDGQITFTAVEDTFIDVTETLPMGMELSLFVEDDPPELQQSLIRFDVTGLPDGELVSSAVLRLYVEASASELVAVHEVEGEWDELSTTATNAPGLGLEVATFLPDTDLAIVEVDITDLLPGDGPLDLYLVATSARTTGFGSRESINPPTLVVRWD